MSNMTKRLAIIFSISRQQAIQPIGKRDDELQKQIQTCWLATDSYRIKYFALTFLGLNFGAIIVIISCVLSSYKEQ